MPLIDVPNDAGKRQPQDLVDNLFPDFTHPPPPSRFPSRTLLSPSPVRSSTSSTTSTVSSSPAAISRLSGGSGRTIVLSPSSFVSRTADDVQWPLMKDEAAVKVDGSHYFFSLCSPEEDTASGSDSDDEKRDRKGKGKKNNKEKPREYDLLNYGLSFASKGQEKRLKEQDRVLEMYTAFSVQKMSARSKERGLFTW